MADSIRKHMPQLWRIAKLLYGEPSTLFVNCDGETHTVPSRSANGHLVCRYTSSERTSRHHLIGRAVAQLLKEFADIVCQELPIGPMRPDILTVLGAKDQAGTYSSTSLSLYSNPHKSHVSLSHA